MSLPQRRNDAKKDFTAKAERRKENLRGKEKLFCGLGCNFAKTAIERRTGRVSCLNPAGMSFDSALERDVAVSKLHSQPEVLVLSSKRSLPGCLQKYKE
jgi:hypothetical protein